MVFDFLKPRQKPFRVETKEERILREVREKINKKSQVARSKRRILPTSAERFQVGKRVGTFVAAGVTMREDFTQEQDMLGQMFGGGSKIWGQNNEPVRINNDLHPSISDKYDETASMFGFGGRI